MNKFLMLKKTKDELQILSCSVSESNLSYIHVEAYKESHVRQAIRGISFLFQKSVRKVKKEEAPSILTAKNTNLATRL